jgi:hypothetical protein
MPSKPTVPLVCEQCRRDFLRAKSQVEHRGGRYCSKACSIVAHRRAYDPYVVFNLPYVRSETGCRLLVYPSGPKQGQIRPTYVVVGFGSKSFTAHRLAWEASKRRRIPDGKVICHSCDNPPCIEPSHLFLGSQRDNSRDMARKGRSPWQAYPELIRRGESHHGAKLTEADVREIRRAAQSGVPTPELARRFGVGASAINRAVARHSWKHVPS